MKSAFRSDTDSFFIQLACFRKGFHHQNEDKNRQAGAKASNPMACSSNLPSNLISPPDDYLTHHGRKIKSFLLNL